MALPLPKKQLYHLSGNCLNRKKPYPRECRLCLQACPHGALTEKKEIITDKCTECGICMAACPSDGIVDRDMDRLGDFLWKADNIVLNCPMAEPLGFEISCLGMLDRDTWYSLLLLGEQKEVRIVTGDCGKCDDVKACTASINILKDILKANPKLLNLKIEINPFNEDSVIAGKEVDKKAKSEALLSWRTKSKERFKSLLTKLDQKDESYKIPKSREWFAQSLALNPERKIKYKALLVNEDCTGCGVCSKICPQQALEQTQQDGKVRLIYEPYNCVQCSRCVDICGTKALKLDYVNFSDKLLKGKILVKETEIRTCTRCGKPIFHKKEPQVCLQCAAKDPELKGVLY